MKLCILLYFSVDELNDLSESETAALADNNIKKIVEWPVKPSVGEQLELGKEQFDIVSVEHRFAKGFIEVQCFAGKFNGAKALMEDRPQWDTSEMSPEGLEILETENRKI